jgi:hypothetical protein
MPGVRATLTDVASFDPKDPQQMTQRKSTIPADDRAAAFCFPYAAGIICFLMLLFLAFISWRYGTQWLDSDMSSEMLLGKLLAEENSFVSRNWFYSTELRLLNTQLITAFLFRFFDDWPLVRCLAVFVWNLLLVVSYVYFAHALAMSRPAIASTTLLLLLPLSLDRFNTVHFGGFYMPHIVLMFLFLDLYLPSAHPSGPAPIGRGVKKFRVLFLVVLAFYFGLAGIRYFLIVLLPLFLTELYYTLKKLQAIPSGIGMTEDMPAKRLRTALIKLGGTHRGLLSALFCCASAGLGYLIHQGYLTQNFSFHSYSGVMFANFSRDLFLKIGVCFYAIVHFFGYSAKLKFVSPLGFFNWFALFFLPFLGYLMKRCMAGLSPFAGSGTLSEAGMKSLPEQQGFLFIFFLFSIIFNGLVLILQNDQEIFTTSRYFIPPLILYIPVLGILFDNIGSRGWRCILAPVFLILVIRGAANYAYLPQYDRNNYAREGYTAYLMQNRLNDGFATYWNANITTELTNGRTTMTGMTEPKAGAFYYWLAQKRQFDPAAHSGRAFLLLTRQEYENAATEPLVRAGHPGYTDAHYIVLEYESAAPFFETKP